MILSKRLFDIGLSVLLMLVLSPLFILIAVWLLLTQGAPVFYPAERMRDADRAFTLWKFRTMTTLAEDSGVSGGDKAARITPAGRFLRRTRLDELPQLWNILRGDMSFVGPRPPLRFYVERFPVLYRDVLKSRPGVTGLATLHFHAHEEFLLSRCRTSDETDAVYRRSCIPRKARLDLIYAANRSFCVDVMILWRTAKRVMRR
jgi:lipopolysaccharide/colanic/teichoic acid biosynthesis glycosyltransferase